MADVPLVNNPMTAVADSIIGGTVTGGVAAPTRLKNNWSAAVAPTVNEDSGDGYAIGSRWIDTTADKEYVALDVTVGAAVWTETTSGGGGSVATDAIWDAAGDLAVGTGANTAARLAIGATNGMTLARVSGAAAWALPPGYEYNYTQITSGVNITATTEATANTVVTASAGLAFDGSTVALIEFYCPWARTDITSRFMGIYLYDDTGGGAATLGRVAALIQEGSVNNQFTPVYVAHRVTPSNATHTYSIRASVGNAVGGVVNAGAGGSGNDMPAFIRITKV